MNSDWKMEIFYIYIQIRWEGRGSRRTVPINIILVPQEAAKYRYWRGRRGDLALFKISSPHAEWILFTVMMHNENGKVNIEVFLPSVKPGTYTGWGSQS